MSTSTVIAPVRKTVRVKAPIAHAFEVFTSGLTRWWPHNHGIGKKPIQKVLMEPRLGGRWLEISEDGKRATVWLDAKMAIVPFGEGMDQAREIITAQVAPAVDPLVSISKDTESGSAVLCSNTATSFLSAEYSSQPKRHSLSSCARCSFAFSMLPDIR